MSPAWRTENNAKINSQICQIWGGGKEVNMNTGDLDYLGPFTTMKASVDHCKTFARKHCSKVVRRILSNKSKTVYIICTRGKKTNNKRHVAAPGTDERDKQPKGIWMRV